MSSDRARVSYDPARKYRSVVAQQGRVTLEADLNEASRISDSIVTAHTIDIVGPSGTPDDGYEITKNAASPRDFDIGPGTMYVGGVRASLDEKVTYLTQLEWIDRHVDPFGIDDRPDPLWIDGAEIDAPAEFVGLLLREHEVGAVEDRVLLDEALGGPDTAQRTRLIQRIFRAEASSTDCKIALNDALAKCLKGVAFNPADMTLKGEIGLKVIPEVDPQEATVCEPQAQGGYIGADNQLIRVQLMDYEPREQRFTLLWGFNNASFLYRAVPKDTATLILQAAPVDEYHEPRAGRVIELLRSAARLEGDNYVAAHAGLVPVGDMIYDRQTRKITLTGQTAAPVKQVQGPIFVRLWEGQVTWKAGEKVSLPGTGLTIELLIDAPPEEQFGPLSKGLFWTFAVRPNAPSEIYPRRYLDSHQPPEGPRMWLCPLGTINRAGEAFAVDADCREQFDNLVELTKRKSGGGCCSVVIGPEDVEGGYKLGAYIEDLVDNNQRVSISLRSGRYKLKEPLKFSKNHENLILSGCRDGVELMVSREADRTQFYDGLIQLQEVANVTLQRLDVFLPSATEEKMPSIGVNATRCDSLKIDACSFRYLTETNDYPTRAAGVRIASFMSGFRLTDCVFAAVKDVDHVRVDQARNRLYGLFASPDPILNDPEFAPGQGGLEAPVLDDALIMGNEFRDISIATFFRGDLGRIRCENNRAQDCEAGLHFIELDTGLLVKQLIEAERLRNRDLISGAIFSVLWQEARPDLIAEMHEFAALAPLRNIRPLTPVQLAGVSPRGRSGWPEARALNETFRTQLSVDSKGEPLSESDLQRIPGNGEAALLPDREALLKLLHWSVISRREGNQPTVRPPDLRVSGNDIAILPSQAGAGAVLATFSGLFLRANPNPKGVLVATANSIRGSGPGYISLMTGWINAVLTGNVFFNSYVIDGGLSACSLRFKTDGGGLISISGNIFQEDATIIPDPPGAHCDCRRWVAINSMSEFKLG